MAGVFFIFNRKKSNKYYNKINILYMCLTLTPNTYQYENKNANFGDFNCRNQRIFK